MAFSCSWRAANMFGIRATLSRSQADDRELLLFSISDVVDRLAALPEVALGLCNDGNGLRRIPEV